MTEDQAKQLKRAIRQLVRAEVAMAFKGAAHPDDHEIIEDDLRSARIRVGGMVTRFTLKNVIELRGQHDNTQHTS